MAEVTKKLTLLERLIEIQRVLGLSDRGFAAVLGVHDSLWTNTRNGKTPIRFQVLTGALQAFPHNEGLKLEVLDFLSNVERDRVTTQVAQAVSA